MTDEQLEQLYREAEAIRSSPDVNDVRGVVDCLMLVLEEAFERGKRIAELKSKRYDYGDLSVVLDYNEELGGFPIELRMHLRLLLPKMKLVEGWRGTISSAKEEVWTRMAIGEQRIVAQVARKNPHSRYEIVGLEAKESTGAHVGLTFSTVGTARQVCDDAIKRDGVWIMVDDP